MKTQSLLVFFLAAVYGLIFSVSLFHRSTYGQSTEWEDLHGPMAPGGIVDALVVSPSEPNRLFTMIEGNSGQRLFRSDDGALTWQHILTLTDILTEPVAALTIDPTGPETLYMGNSGHLMRSNNGGISWTQLFTMGQSIVVADTNHLYAADKIGEPDPTCSTGYFGVGRSSDGGLHWSVTSVGCASSLPLLAAHPQNSSLIYVGGTDRTNSWGTLLRSTDGGQNFSLLPLGRRIAHPLHDLLLLPTNPAILFVSDESGILYSQDSGESWRRITTGPLGSGIPSQNLPEKPFELAADSAGVVYAAEKDPSNNGITMYRSEDAGQTWWSAVQPLPDEARILVPHPHIPGKLYVGLNGFGIWQSTTAGGSWSENNQGIRSLVQVESLAVPPNDSTILYAASYYGVRPGIYRSTDSGLSWTRVLTDIPVRAVAVNPLTPTLAYAGTDTDLWVTGDGTMWYPNYVEQLVNGFAISPAGPQWSYAIGTKSPYEFDNGVRLARGRFLKFYPGDPAKAILPSWVGQEISNTLWGAQIAVDPIDPKIVYSAVTLEPYDVIYRSLDGGETWQQILPLIRDIEQILIDSRFPNRIYVSSPFGSFFSLDRGATWVPLADGPQNYTYNVALDNAGNVCGGTDNGVWCLNGDLNFWYSTGLENVRIRSLVSSSDRNNQQWMYAGTATGVWRRKVGITEFTYTWLPLIQK